jgi:hypothetical protein
VSCIRNGWAKQTQKNGGLQLNKDSLLCWDALTGKMVAQKKDAPLRSALSYACCQL